VIGAGGHSACSSCEDVEDSVRRKEVETCGRGLAIGTRQTSDTGMAVCRSVDL
jgi:hypothetical protein